MSTEIVQAESTEASAQPINRQALVAAAMAVLAIVGLFFAGMAVIAVFVVGAGHVALNQIQQRGERGRGFAIAALVVGYGIGLLSLGSALIFAITSATQ
jgi:NO-binding membrane sensor protein with MHYT domain